MSGNFNSYLKTEFESRKNRNQRYSLRKFSKDLDVSPAVMSRLLNDKAVVSVKTLIKIQNKIHVPDHIFQKKLAELSQRKNSNTEALAVFDQLELEIVKKWYFPLVIEMLTLADSTVSLNTISEELSLSLTDIESCVALAVQKKILIPNNVDDKIRYSIPSRRQGYRLYDQLGFQEHKIQQKVFGQLVGQLDSMAESELKSANYSTIYLKAHPEIIDELKSKIKFFKKSLFSFVGRRCRDKSNQVYQLSIGLSPITKRS